VPLEEQTIRGRIAPDPVLVSNGEEAMSKMTIVAEFWEFLRYRKKYWLLPMLAVFALLGALIVVMDAAPAVAPFIYLGF
jgi:hypothetical protein